ncbi:hypothetical protein C2869_13340 [Saccharobesus litoralis]|uniref:Uncharacterized protein n=1 Tax=Saccharobesus litoralis TaxID=2172099 RepID=A0A2S0VT20_9ALTE|nr:hypothetical protein C2869_13340 [Saccharobesus litoralis]
MIGFVLVGCASAPKPEESQNQVNELKRMGKDVLDMVPAPDSQATQSTKPVLTAEEQQKQAKNQKLAKLFAEVFADKQPSKKSSEQQSDPVKGVGNNTEGLSQSQIEADQATVDTTDNETNSAVIESAPILVNRYQAQQNDKMAAIPAEVLAQFDNGVTEMEQGNWQQADSIFDEILSAYPTLSGVLVNKALVAEHGHKDLMLTQQLAEQALAVNQDNPYAHNILGRLARQQGQFKQAEVHYLSALDIWPQYPEANLNMAILLELYRGRLFEAFSYYESYLASNPEDKLVKRWFAGLQIKLKRLEQN